jgi:sulfur carrier protein
VNDPGAISAVTVNRRDAVSWAPGMTVDDLLQRMNYTFPRLVISINGTVVPHSAYGATEIPEGADVRVIHLMAGG